MSAVKELRSQAQAWVKSWTRVDEPRLRAELLPLLRAIRKKIFVEGVSTRDLWDEAEIQETESLMHDFREALGHTPIEYVRDLRVRAGLGLLEDRDAKVGKIAKALGYKTVSVFSTAVKRVVKQRPSEYRRKMRGREKEKRGAAARLAVVRHEEAAQLLRRGKAECAFERLLAAHGCYLDAEDLSSELSARASAIGLPRNPKEAVLESLCLSDRQRLVGVEGRALCSHLSDGLRMVPGKLDWFEESCPRCVHRIFDCFSHSRMGLMSNVWRAEWLLKHTTRRGPGWFIAMIVGAHSCMGGDQSQGLEYCEKALAEADALQNQAYEALGNIWYGYFLTETGDYNRARVLLNREIAPEWYSPWLEALRLKHLGLLEKEVSNYADALECYRKSTEIFGWLDEDCVARNRMLEGAVYFHIGKFEEALAYFTKCRQVIDSRRNPAMTFCVLPVNRAAALAMLGRLEEAERMLEECHIDGAEQPSWKAAELFTRACIMMLRKDYRFVIRLIEKAAKLFGETGSLLNVGLAWAYAAEAYAGLKDFSGSLVCIGKAIKIFETLNDSAEIIKALGTIRGILERAHKDAALIEAKNLIRRLGKDLGGWLPVEVPGAILGVSSRA